MDDTMRDLLSKLEAIEQQSDLPEVGDAFGISLSEDFEIATEIVGFTSDGIVVELDDEAQHILESQGVQFYEGYIVEEKQKGLDGKACWKGYRRMGTKMKGGKRVDNCVKVKEDIEETNHLQMAKHHEVIAKEMNRIEKEADDEDDELYSGAAFEGEQFHQKAAQLHRNAYKTKSEKDSREANDYTRRTIDHGETHHFTIKGKGGAGDYGHDFSILHKHFTALQKALGGDDEVDESGLQYYTGVKKHGKEYMKKAAQAGREGASQEELGRLKDKYSKAEKNKKTKEDFDIDEAEYQGRDVPLGKKMPGDVKKYKVYVRKPNGNVVKVNFGDKKMRIKKSNPARRKSFRARHNCKNPGPRWKARYWSCRNW